LSASSTLLVYGTSHELAPMEIREQLTLDPERMEEAYATLQDVPGVDELLILNTCNRVEVYAAGTMEKPMAFRAILSGLTGTMDRDWEQVERHLEGREAVEHCLRVAAGLDSQMVGETEILGQIKKAYQDAVDRSAAGPVIHRLFQQSFRVGKWVRTHTGLGRGQVSAPTVAASLADRIFGHLQGAEILVVGTGEMGEATIKVLMSEGASSPAFTGRNRERVAELASNYEADIIAYEHWKEKIHHFDILMTSTSAEGWILGRKDVEAALSRRRSRPLFLIDLAMPRDIEPSTAKLEGVYLYNLDDLAEVANENLEARHSEIERSMTYITSEANDLWKRLSEEGAYSGEAVSSSSGKSGG
jgi:glutamyl-tRNA reductase